MWTAKNGYLAIAERSLPTRRKEEWKLRMQRIKRRGENPKASSRQKIEARVAAWHLGARVSL